METPFEPVPSAEIPPALRGGTYFGVPLPRRVPFFDCRWSDERPEPRNPHTGLILWGTERAEFALGELRAGVTGRFAHPAGFLISYDTRDPRHAERTAREIRHLRALLARVWADYHRALRNLAAPGEGGGVVFPPVAIALSNFGGTVLADSRAPVTYRLTSPRHRGPRKASRKLPSLRSTDVQRGLFG